MSQSVLCSGSRRLHRTDSRSVAPHRRHDVGAGRLALVGTHEMSTVVDTAEMWDPQVIVHPDDSFDRVDALALGGGVISITWLDSRAFEPRLLNRCSAAHPRRGLSFFSRRSHSADDSPPESATSAVSTSEVSVSGVSAALVFRRSKNMETPASSTRAMMMITTVELLESPCDDCTKNTSSSGGSSRLTLHETVLPATSPLCCDRPWECHSQHIIDLNSH